MNLASGISPVLRGWAVSSVAFRRFPTRMFYGYLFLLFPLPLYGFIFVFGGNVDLRLSTASRDYAWLLEASCLTISYVVMLISVWVASRHRLNYALPAGVYLLVSTQLSFAYATLVMEPSLTTTGRDSALLGTLTLSGPSPALILQLEILFLVLPVLSWPRWTAGAWMRLATVVAASFLMSGWMLLSGEQHLSDTLIALSAAAVLTNVIIAFSFLAGTARFRRALVDAVAGFCMLVLTLMFFAFQPDRFLGWSIVGLTGLVTIVTFFDAYDLTALRRKNND